MVTLKKVVTFVLVGIFVINILTTSLLFTMLMFFGQYILSKRSAQLLSCRVAWMLGNEVVFIGSWLSKIKIVLYGNADDIDMIKDANYLVNMNHRYELDFYTAWFMGSVTDIVHGAKVCLKEELRRVPILGKVWEGMGFIFLEREWNKDRGNLDRACSALCDYATTFVVLIFCEGTRFTEAKVESSNEYARKHGMKELKHHLIPRTRGFLHILKSLRPSISGVYDVTCRFEGAKPSLLNMLLGADMTAHCHIRRFELAKIPTAEDECSKWLFKLYEEKDDLVEGFLKTGVFPGIRSPRRPPVPGMVLSLFLLIFYTLPLLYFLACLIASLPATALYISAVSLTVGIFALCYKIWGYSRVSKASNYGLQSPQKNGSNAVKAD